MALADADGKIITAIPTPNDYQTLCVFFSNEDISVGNSYKILSYKDSFDDTPVTEYEFTMESLFIMLGKK